MLRRAVTVTILAVLSTWAVPALAVAQSADTTNLAVNTTGDRNPVRPGDIIRLKIWREPDLSGDFPIQEDGEVVFPKLGPMRVADELPSTIRARVVSAYSQYLAQTSIDVVVLRRVQVAGAVKNPGLYPVDGTMTVSDAIALAGGITVDGNNQKVTLRRDGRDLLGNMSQQTRISQMPIQSGDQLYVPYRSWLSRNGYLAGSVFSAVVTGLVIILRR